MNNRFDHLNAALKPLVERDTPPAYRLETKTHDVKGRVEHEAILKDPKKCEELGLDIYFETMVYLKRWGGWLHETN